MEGLNPNLNPKQFPVGSVVYFLRNRPMSFVKEVCFGTVLEHYSSEIAVQIYELRDYREINGVPVKEFKTPSEWRKLPKGWSWDTVMFRVTNNYPESFEDECFIDIQNPDKILRAINLGFLVKPSDNDHAEFRAEIDSKHGWRIIREYDKYHPDYLSLPFNKVYASWREAREEIDRINEEFNRQKALTDLEWSIEQIDHELDRWAYIYSITPEAKKAVRDRIMALNNLEDVVVRMFEGHIEWKYDRNRRWIRIEP